MDTRVGVRQRAEVQQAYERLEAAAAGPQQQTQYARGAMAGYVWAMGRTGATAPVTGERCAEQPSDKVIESEREAADAQLANQVLRTTPRDYLQGVHEALAWICGVRDNEA